jgi:2-methylcitrate dehydratase PrpD
VDHARPETRVSGVVPASRLLGEARPSWLPEWTAFARDLRLEDVPAPVVEQAKLVLLDTVGVVAAGMQEPELRRLLDRRAADQGAAAVIGGGATRSPRTAALLNGTAGTSLELDEGNQFARGHPGIQVIPAVLAAGAAQGVAGARALEAIILGYELGARIGIASKLHVAMHPHGTWGSAAAALAVARLNGATAAQTAAAVNIASSLALATSRRTMLEGATVRNVYTGVANDMGLLTWDLVEAGFTGEADGVATVYDGVAADGFQAGEMLDGLGARWEIARNYFKRHAACRYTHGALDALQAIVAQAGGRLDPAAVADIEVRTYVWAAQLDLAEPPTMLAAKFSIPFAVAATVVHGAATVAAFRPPALFDPQVRALAARVRVAEDPALTAMLPARRPARVAVTLTDGRRFEAEALLNKGDVEDPYGPAEVAAKFDELAGTAWGAAGARRVADAVLGLDTAPDLGPLNALLAR